MASDLEMVRGYVKDWVTVLLVVWVFVGCVGYGASVGIPMYSSVNIRIIYARAWWGSYDSNGTLQEIEGDGNTTIQVDRPGEGNWTLSVVVNKRDPLFDLLTVSIETLEGTVLVSDSTTAELGMVSLVWTDTPPITVTPPIPGFPVAAIILAIISGLGVRILTRRKKTRKGFNPV